MDDPNDTAHPRPQKLEDETKSDWPRTLKYTQAIVPKPKGTMKYETDNFGLVEQASGCDPWLKLRRRKHGHRIRASHGAELPETSQPNGGPQRGAPLLLLLGKLLTAQ